MKIRQLHHVAYRCRDAAETAEFYTELLDLPLAHTIVQERVPSTQEHAPHAHVFFEMADASYMAFFDIADEHEVVQGTDPDWAQHIALELGSLDELDAAQQRLTDAGVDVLGPVDHGFIRSIYFRDPSGHRLELTVRTHGGGELDRYADEAAGVLAAWTDSKG